MVDFLVKYEAVKGQIMSFKTSYGIVAAVAAYVFAAAIAQENYAGRLPPGSSRRFAEKFLAPLVARLDGLAERAKPEMSDAEVEAFSAADLSALVDVKFEVARRRHDWLEKRISAVCE